jgi:hypothetical protein
MIMIASISKLYAIDYMLDPKALQKAFDQCLTHDMHDISCDEIKRIVSDMNDNIHALQRDPLAYGQSILALQMRIAADERAQDKDTLSQLALNTARLKIRLAVIRWLESPGG